MKEQLETKNALITGTSLTIADHNCLVAWLDLEFEAGGQGFGGYALYLPKSFANHDIMSFAGHYIYRVLEVAGVTKWEDLKGKTVRVVGSSQKLIAIGHIIKHDWFYPEKDLKKGGNEE